MRIVGLVLALVGCAHHSQYAIETAGTPSDQAIIRALATLGYDAFADRGEIRATARHQPPPERQLQQQSCLIEDDGSIRFRTETNQLVVRRHGARLIVHIDHVTCRDAGGRDWPSCSTVLERSADGGREIYRTGRHLELRLSIR